MRTKDFIQTIAVCSVLLFLLTYCIACVFQGVEAEHGAVGVRAAIDSLQVGESVTLRAVISE